VNLASKGQEQDAGRKLNLPRFGEQRCRIIGASRWRLLFVVYTERKGGVTWIISAREVTPHEKEKYYGG
jgi:uncharacterized DUF497 family protein